MTIVGFIIPEDNVFVIEIPCINVITQALTEDEIIYMAKDAIETLAHGQYKFKIKVTRDSNRLFIESKQKDFIKFVVLRMKNVC